MEPSEKKVPSSGKPEARSVSRRQPGSGSVYPTKDGRFEGHMQIGWDKDNRPIRKRFAAPTREAALEKLAALQKKVAENRPVSRKEWKVGEYLDYWLEQFVLPPKMAPNTYKNYRSAVNVHLKGAFAGLRLGEVKAEDVRVFLNRLSVTHAKRTVKTLQLILSSAYRVAVEFGWADENPAHPARPDRHRRVAEAKTAFQPTRFNHLSQPELRRLFDTALAFDDPYRAAYALAAGFGLRIGEIFGLKWTAVRLEGPAPSVSIVAQMQKVDGKLRIDQPPKSDSAFRRITISGEMVALLREQKAHQDALRAAQGTRYVDRGLVFATRYGTPISNQQVLNTFYRTLARAGLPQIRFHDLRHTAATVMHHRGLSWKQIQEILGHADLATTTDIYGHVAQTMEAEGAAAMEGLFYEKDPSLSVSSGPAPGSRVGNPP